MKRLLLILLACVPAFGAAGDIVSATMADNGWEMTVRISGLATNGTFAFGFGANNTISGSEKIAITLNSCGFNDDGSTNATARTLYGTHAVRFAYPDNAFNNTTNIGGDTYVRVALSDYVYQKDASVTANFASGFYTSGGTPNNSATGVSVDTSAVTNAYPKVIGNWTWPGYERVTSTVRARCVAFHSSGKQGRPVRCVKFSLTDGSATVTSTVTAMAIDSTQSADQLPTAEYYADLSVSTMADKTLGTLNFIAYPWIGDSGSILDTSAGTAQPTPLAGPIRVLCDKSNNYGGTDVVADAAAADDLSGGTAAAGQVDLGSPPASWKTIGKAINQAVARNNSVHSHNDMGYAQVYLKAGTYALMGSSPGSYGTTPNTWCEIKPYPGVDPTTIKINSQSGNFVPAAARIKISGGIQLGDGTTTGANVIGGGTTIWIHKCVVNYTANSWFTGTSTILHLTQSTNTGVAKLTEFGTSGNAPGVVRGNSFGSGTLTIAPYCVVGNKRGVVSANGNSSIITSAGITAAPQLVNWVVYNNIFLGFSATSGTAISVNNGGTDTNAIGGALVQNVLEKTDTSSTTGGIGIGSDSTTGTPINNILEWHNTIAGVKMNGPYNSKGTAIAVRQFWSQKNSAHYDWNQKPDTFTGDGGASGVRVGNWPSGVYCVGSSGMFRGDDGNGFDAEFAGLNTIALNWIASTGTDYFKFVSYAAYEGPAGGAGSGLGNYRLQSNSPLITGTAARRDWIIPYDIEGHARGELDPPGAYASANPRKGGFFF